jgi:signal transduction histidine kinase
LELVALNSGINKKSHASYSQIFDEIQRMSIMLGDLSTLTNADAGGQPINLTSFNIDDLITQICKSLRVLASEAGLVINHDMSSGVGEVIADKNKVEQLISNLVRNAIRYNKKNGFINIWLDRTSDGIELFVEDGGVGISSEYLSLIFERFYRVDKTRSRNSGGSGLGLSICKWVAEAHGGKIEVKSELGKGSTFKAFLPQHVDKFSN